MNVFRKFSVLEVLKSASNLKKTRIPVQFYSDKVKSNKTLEPNNVSKNIVNEKNISKKMKHTINEYDVPKDLQETVISSDMKMSVKCKKAGTISVALVGGGCAAVCATILLKQHPAIKEIRIIDTDNSLAGPVCDIRQIDTSVIVKYYKRKSMLEGLQNSNIVALMDETQFTLGDKGPFSQFESSSKYVKNVAECMINSCPNALIAIFARPVTATVPLVSQIYGYSGNWDPNKIIGSAQLESMKIASLAANYLDLNPSFMSIPIAGGVDALTIVPLLSRTVPYNTFSEADQSMLIHKLKTTDKRLSECESKGPTLSSGVAVAKFVSTLINGIKGQSISITSAFVRSDIFPSCQYMTSQLKFGPNGVQQNFGIPKITSREISLIEQSTPIINKIVNTVTYFMNTGKIN